MKKTVLFKEMNGHKIIAGIDKPVIDNVETNKVILGYKDEAGKDVPGLIHATDEWKALEAKKAEYAAAVAAHNEAVAKKDKDAYDSAVAGMKVKQEELVPISKEAAEKIEALRLENAVYCHPKAGEVIVDASEADELFERIQGRPPHTLVGLDGSLVSDNRRAVFYRKASGKWQKTTVTEVGVEIPKDAVLEDNVTDKQRGEIERDRVQALPEAVRKEEKQKALATALEKASSMRSGLEIEGDKDALKKSQDWYNQKKKDLEKLYG
jgi:hypothetical protein